MRAIEILRQHLDKIGSALQQLVVDRDRAADAAGAAALGLLQAQQADIIAGVRMEANLRIGVVASSGGPVVLTEVFHVAKDVAIFVLRHLVSEISANTEIRDRSALAIEFVEREVLHHDHAATVEQLLPHVSHETSQRSKRKIRARNIDERLSRRPKRMDGGN